MNDENKALGFAKARSFAIRCSEGNVDFNKSDFILLVISKFLLLKEKVIKKDDNNNVHLMTNKYNDIINAIGNYIATHATKLSLYGIDVFGTNDPLLRKNIIIVQRLRNAIAHNYYDIDYENNMLIINNCGVYNGYRYDLVCNVPISLLDTFIYSEVEAADFRKLYSREQFPNTSLANYADYIRPSDTEVTALTTTEKHDDFLDYLQEMRLRYHNNFDDDDKNKKRIMSMFSEIQKITGMDQDGVTLASCYNYLRVLFASHHDISDIGILFLDLNKFKFEGKIRKEQLQKLLKYVKGTINVIKLYLGPYGPKDVEGIKGKIKELQDNIINFLINTKKEWLNSIRNGIFHANIKIDNGIITIHDMRNQLDDNTVIFKCTGKPVDFIELADNMQKPDPTYDNLWEFIIAEFSHYFPDNVATIEGMRYVMKFANQLELGEVRGKH